MLSSLKCACLIAALMIVPIAAMGRSDTSHAAERTQTNRDIWVQPGEKAGDLACLNCSVHVRGEVSGDVAAIHGNVIVEPQAEISGDIASFFGDVQVENDAHVAGDVAAMGGTIRRDPRGAIGGNQATFPRILFLLIMLAPLVVLGLIVALIVWLVQRRRQPMPRTA